MIEKVVACSKEKKRRNGGKNTHSNALRSFRRSIASRWHRTTSSCILSQKHFSTNLSLLVRAIPVTTEPARREPPSYLAGGSRDTVCSSAKRRYRRLLHKRNAPVGGPDKSVWPLRSRCLCLGHNSRQGCAPRASLSLPSSLPHALAREWVRPRHARRLLLRGAVQTIPLSSVPGRPRVPRRGPRGKRSSEEKGLLK